MESLSPDLEMENLKRLRSKTNLTQEEIAEKSGKLSISLFTGFHIYYSMI